MRNMPRTRSGRFRAPSCRTLVGLGVARPGTISSMARSWSAICTWRVIGVTAQKAACVSAWRAWAKAIPSHARPATDEIEKTPM